MQNKKRNIVIIIFSLTVIFQTVKYVIAEYYFTQGYKIQLYCNKKNPMLCYHASTRMNKAIKFNSNEYFYKRYISLTLLKLYRLTKNKKVLQIAYKWCKASHKNAWDKHYPYICEADILALVGEKKKALEKLKQAQKLLPHNKKLKKVIESLYL